MEIGFYHKNITQRKSLQSSNTKISLNSSSQTASGQRPTTLSPPPAGAYQWVDTKKYIRLATGFSSHQNHTMIIFLLKNN